jgi:enterobactin synthetase component D
MQRRAQMPDSPLSGGRPNRIHTLLAGTREFVLDLAASIPPGVETIPVAAGLERAVPRRQMQFRAGRYCAAKALEALDPQFARTPIDRATTGAPIWPEGVTGSITHTDDYASAAVAWTTNVRSLGIDTERVMSSQQAGEVGDLIASATELGHGTAAGLPWLEALTLVFSAKESVFKCLHPLVGRMFEFNHVRLIGVDTAVRIFKVEIAKDLSAEFQAGAVLEGRFEIEGHRIHTGMLLEAPTRQQAQATRQAR